MGFPPFAEWVGDREEFYLRPLCAVLPEEVRILWPIMRYRETERDCSWWVLPVAMYTAKQRHGGWDRNLYVLPFFAWGSAPGEGTSWAIFPLAGRLSSFFGYDDARFVLFPLYLRLQDGPQRSYHVLFPFVNWLEGGRRSGWRVWPFFAVYRATGVAGNPRYERYYVLWPFFSYQRNGLNTRAPSTAYVFFPFYGRISSSRLTRTYILWPLYSQEEDRKRHLRSYGMPLLPIRYARGDDLYQLDVWPFFGWRRLGSPNSTEQRFRQFALWPFQRYEEDQEEDLEARRFYVLPFWWHSRTTEKRGRTWRTRAKAWPFFAREATETGERWEALSLLPWFDQDVERFWGRLWTLARYIRNGRHRAFELLWGLFSWEEDEASVSWSIAGGLFGLKKQDAGTTYRVLFLPLSFGGRSEPQAAKKTEEETVR